MSTWRSAATGPTSFRTRCDELGLQGLAGPSALTSMPDFSTTSPRGTCPLSSSATPITAHSATAG